MTTHNQTTPGEATIAPGRIWQHAERNTFRVYGLCAACVAGVLVVYVSTLAVNHSEAEDSLYYVLTVVHGSLADQFHPNHLLFGILNRFFFRLLSDVGYHGSPELTMQILNVIASAFTLFIFYHTLTILELSLPQRLFALFTLAFSYGYWWYSVECETYILPLPFILLAVHRLLLIVDTPSKMLHHVMLGLFHAGAVLMHQQHVLLGIVIILAYLFIADVLKRRPGLLRGFFVYVLASVGPVLLVYVATATLILNLKDVEAMWVWVSGTIATGRWGYWTTSAPWKAVIGATRGIIGGHFLFALETLRDFIQRLLPSFVLREEFFLVRDFSTLRVWLLSVISASVLVSLTYLAIRSGRACSIVLKRTNDLHKLRLAMVICLSYIVIYGTFNSWWEPQNTEFWISPIVFVVLGIAISSAWVNVTPAVTFCRVMIPSGLLIVNLFGSILPQTDHEHDYWYQFNRWLIENAHSDDLIVTGAGYISDAYLRFYTRADVVTTWWQYVDAQNRLEERIALRRPARVLFSSTVYDPPAELYKRFGLDRSIGESLFRHYAGALTLIHDDAWQKMYLYRPSP